MKKVHEHKILVEHIDGSTQEIEIMKEDTEENTKNQEGSKYEVEVDQEVEECA